MKRVDERERAIIIRSAKTPVIRTLTFKEVKIITTQGNIENAT
jgi:hypothetical protein